MLPKNQAHYWKYLLSCLMLLLVAEGGVQISGVVDVPLYQANNRIGYIVAPNQSGAFLHSHSWRFNADSMGAGPFKPDRHRFNLLLIGDSLVLGGNPVAEPQRLGPQLEKMTGWQVWPISAGSWSLQNELTYLREHPHILKQVDAVAIVSNSGDFDAPSSWASELTHPRQHPFPALWYLAKKYLLKPEVPQIPSGLQVEQRDWQLDLQAFAQTFAQPTFVFLYPTLAELQDAALRSTALESKAPLMAARLGAGARIRNVWDSQQWTATLYRDDIHPTEEGNTVLAGILRTHLCASGLGKMNCR